MDLIAEIVEHEVVAPVNPTMSTPTGFPNTSNFSGRKISRWKQNKTQERAPKQLSEAEKIHEENIRKIASMTSEEVSQEREDLLRDLNPKLIQSLLKRTQKRSKADQTDDSFTKEEKVERAKELQRAEGYDGWIGQKRTATGLKDLSQLDEEDVNKALGISKDDLLNDLKEHNENLADLLKDTIEKESIAIDALPESSALKDNTKPKPKKTVSFNSVATVKYEDVPEEVEIDDHGWEDIEDVNEMVPGHEEEIAHDDYQLFDDEDEIKLGVHFTKPKLPEEFDINDPKFYDKLHEKYYPDLPKETEKLKWMTEPMPNKVSHNYESISDMRFDFNGNLLQTDGDIPTYHGLHHHSEDPQMAGYTLTELSRLSRSVVSGQRCLSIKTLGRILHKLGKHKYNILPIGENDDDEAFNGTLNQVVLNFENLVWDVIDELRIIESITEAADEKKTRNLSVNNYAIEALYLWKEGGGRPEVKSEEEAILESIGN